MEYTELENINVTEFDAGQIFSGKPSGRMIKGFDAPCRYTPELNPDYLFHNTMREIIVWFMSPSDPVYVFGPCGSGKTSLVRQIAAKLNYPVFDVTGHSRLGFSDLVGHLSLENGRWSISTDL